MRSFQQSIVGTHETNIRDSKCVPDDKACRQMQRISRPQGMRIENHTAHVDHGLAHGLLQNPQVFSFQIVEGLLSIGGNEISLPLSTPNRRPHFKRRQGGYDLVRVVDTPKQADQRF